MREYIYVNLQLFAQGGGEKTEKATPKKRSEARKKGQILQSREITSSLVLMFTIYTLKITGGNIYNEIAAFLKNVYSRYTEINTIFESGSFTKLFIEVIIVIAKVITPLFAVAFMMGIAASYMQVGYMFTTETLSPKLNRISPLSGLKRMFSLRSIAELVKSIFKILVVGYVAFTYLKSQSNNVLKLMDMDVQGTAKYIASTCMEVAIRICAVLIVLGVADYLYQWWEYEKNLKMSKQEIKEEYKQLEGNPEIKGKIKQKQRQMSMRRMMQEVPKADVVITNPTHFAIAIKYDSVEAAAPIVLAKGQDFMAQKIKEIAKDNRIEIVENKPLARTLYDQVEIGESIPAELYQAVAEVLAFVYSLKNK